MAAVTRTAFPAEVTALRDALTAYRFAELGHDDDETLHAAEALAERAGRLVDALDSGRIKVARDLT